VDGVKALIDSDVLIDYLQGVSAASEEMARYREVRYSIISWMEVMCGAETVEEAEAAKILFDSMSRVELSPEVAARAVDERKRLGLKLPDAIILASADCEGCILVTRNSKDFSESDPRIRFPYTLTRRSR
jgi:predicted nucleic acid-binding protein